MEVSFFEAAYTTNNVTIMYYEEGIYSSVNPDWAASNEATPLITKSVLNWKPDGNNEPSIIRKYANFTCKFTSSTGKTVVTTGRMMIYPYPGKNCTEITTNVTGTVNTTKKCEKLENSVFCKSPEDWKLPPGAEKEAV